MLSKGARIETERSLPVKKLDFLMDKVEEILCTLFLAVMAVAILVQVINRNTLELPFTWGEELARYCMVWLTCIGISAGVKQGSHIGVDALVDMLPAGAKKWLRVVTNVIVTGIYFYMMILSVEITLGIRETRQVSPAMQIPMYIIYSGLIVGMLLSTVRSIQVTIESVRMKPETHSDGEYTSGGDIL